jgi:hypothetical protein
MVNFEIRLSIIECDVGYYIGVETYHEHFNGWMSVKRITRHYPTYDEAAEAYHELERLGYLDPALYRGCLY